MHAATVAPIYVKNAIKGAVNRGYDPEEILVSQGLPPQILHNPKLRISTLAFADLARALTELLGDEALGLLAKPTPVGSLKLLAKACLSSSNVEESLLTWRDGTNWMDTSVSATAAMSEKGGYIAFTCTDAAGIGGNYALESVMSTCHRFHCWQANGFIPIERVDLAHPEPDFSEEHRFVFYGAPVHYNQSLNALHFSRKTLDTECQRTPGDLRVLFSNPHTNILTQPRQSNSVSIKVRLWMEKIFRDGGGLPQLEQASAHLGYTEQTLRRRLQADGYSFQKLKEDTRRDMAIYYIKQSRLSIENIAFKLGFSEASTFIRAFKKWTGLTPLAYRRL